MERGAKSGNWKTEYRTYNEVQAMKSDLSNSSAMREAVKSYSELRVYQLAFEAAMTIFELSKRWPPEEKYSLTDQIRRSSRSVCGNIAEAWRKRRYPAHFVSKLSDADTIEFNIYPFYIGS